MNGGRYIPSFMSAFSAPTHTSIYPPTHTVFDIMIFVIGMNNGRLIPSFTSVLSRRVEGSIVLHHPHRHERHLNCTCLILVYSIMIMTFLFDMNDGGLIPSFTSVLSRRVEGSIVLHHPHRHERHLKCTCLILVYSIMIMMFLFGMNDGVLLPSFTSVLSRMVEGSIVLHHPC